MAIKIKEPARSQLDQPKTKKPKPAQVPSHAKVNSVKRPTSTSYTRRGDLTEYFSLVRKFPLVPIRDDAHLAKALTMVEGLLKRDLDEGSESYLNVLSVLVEDYEDGIGSTPDASEADVLSELMRTNGLSQTALQEKVGIAQSTISAVLSGSRYLTKDQVIRLARFFHVTPAAFLRTN